MIENYIKIKGKYVRQEDIPPEQMKEISKEIITRLAAGFGYVPVEKPKERS